MTSEAPLEATLEETPLFDAGEETTSLDSSSPPSANTDPEIRVWMSDRGFIRLKLPPAAAVTGAMVKEAGIRVRLLAEGESFPVLMDITGVISFSKEARDVYLSLQTGAPDALLGRSPVDRVVAHYFLGPGYPGQQTAYFTDETEAVAWLEARGDDG